MRVPFKSIRYRSREPVEMGIIFERNISRYSEAGTYPALDPARGFDFLTQTRPLHFIGIKHYTLLEILPAFTYGRTSLIDRGVLEPEKTKSDLSLTAKYGLTSQLILDRTVNPDFSQVESDAGQVDFNLRYALFYPEKRPFPFGFLIRGISPIRPYGIAAPLEKCQRPPDERWMAWPGVILCPYNQEFCGELS
ncbi:MAG: hypothetical protein JXE07_06975 [Candidatus Aminicenantes bacterium]|nr:hypothetical protein [Candidatus Aminicenantes bacterium]